MPLRVSNIRLPVEQPESSLVERLARILGTLPGDIHSWRILRKSLDAREKHGLCFVYAVEACLADETAFLPRSTSYHPVEVFHEEPFHLPPIGERPLQHRPVVVGSGPAGLAAGFFLAQAGFQPLVLERGKAVRERIQDVRAFDTGGAFNPESNYLFGEGGAGTFSDGKLTYRGAGPEVRRILQLFAEHKGKPSVLYDYRPHLGSNRLPAVVKALRQAIHSLGGEVRFSTRVEDFDIQNGQLTGLFTSSGYLNADAVFLAIGHSARDTYEALFQRGVAMELRPFQLGVRIEQPQETVNRVKYGPQKLEEILGAADYSLVANGRRDLFTFCMCAGGYIMPSVSEPGAFCTNGMSLSKHDSPFANSGLVVTINPGELESTHPLAGVEFQRKYERLAFAVGKGDYLCPIQGAGDFLAGRSSNTAWPNSYPRGAIAVPLESILPPQVIEALADGLPILDRKFRGRFLQEATLVGPESRGSAPLRILREETTRESPSAAGLFPIGEGAGFAGGIVSAALDGLRSAVRLISTRAPAQ
ncbi:MAG: FAD-dependent oxidoreductase [Gemmataceae bacterium]|nr:FAD-dependent oxidoreductase [Gemmataceae bacterium]